MTPQSSLLSRLDEYRLELCAGLACLGSLAVVSGAWGFQLIGGYVPCALCLQQRVPYYVGLPIALIALLLSRFTGMGRNPARLLLVLFALLMLYGGAIGVYQAGAEWSFWSGPDDCGGGQALAGSASNLLDSLKNTKVVSCSQASFRMFGLSFAGWNVVASLGLTAVALWGAAKRRA